MSNYRSHSGERTISTDHSNSAGMVVPLSLSSADPLSLASRMRNCIWLEIKPYKSKQAPNDISYHKDQHTPHKLTPEESELYQHNMQHREPEPEDEFLVASGVLDKLLAQAQKELLTEDWEQELAEL